MASGAASQGSFGICFVRSPRPEARSGSFYTVVEPVARRAEAGQAVECGQRLWEVAGSPAVLSSLAPSVSSAGSDSRAWIGSVSIRSPLDPGTGRGPGPAGRRPAPRGSAVAQRTIVKLRISLTETFRTTLTEEAAGRPGACLALPSVIMLAWVPSSQQQRSSLCWNPSRAEDRRTPGARHQLAEDAFATSRGASGGGGDRGRCRRSHPSRRHDEPCHLVRSAAHRSGDPS